MHARSIFEMVGPQLDARPPASLAQRFVETLDLGPAARALLGRWRQPLERLGFAFEEFGADAVVLRAVPTLLKGDEPKRLVEALLEEFADTTTGAPPPAMGIPIVDCPTAT